jgi:hypothetical protein
VEDELFVRAVVGGGALGSDMIGGFEGDWIFRLELYRSGGSGTAGSTQRAHEPPDDLIDEAVNPHMNFIPNSPELSLKEEPDGA